MSKPESFCTLCTIGCAYELVGLLLSLSIYHTNEKIFILCDSATKATIDEMTPKPKLKMIWFIELDKYSNKNRFTMEKEGIWSEFQMKKAESIRYALEHSENTMFLDSDIIISDVIHIDKSKQIGISPQFITEEHINKTGYYNGGVLWTKCKEVTNDWIEFTKTSRYYDQASIEDLAKKYDYFEFGENYNLQCWRYYLSPESSQQIKSNITYKINDKLYYKNKPLKFIHTHFLDQRFHEFNTFIIQSLVEAKLYKLLAIIYRVIRKKWVLKIPKQPIQGLGYHKNDSYRELPILMKVKNKDVDVQFHSNTIHCWIEPNIHTYDRPTLEWINNEFLSASLLLLGNGDVKVEGKEIISRVPNLTVKPWIFWPRKPMLLEKILKRDGILKFEERNILSIFIGNIENNVQSKFRNDNTNWSNTVQEFHITQGKQHKFTHEEYLLKLRSSKYGLCLRGYGSKCHREVELMAFGSVPIITKHVNYDSYLEPLEENKHFIYVTTPEEMNEKLNKISIEEWKIMSEQCYQWYQRNVHSDNLWNNLISKILYHD